VASNSQGAGLAQCNNCTVDNVYNNTVTGSSADGGGLSECDYCTITNVHGNTSTNSGGGGLFDCDYCTIDGVYDNTSSSNGGGGLYGCDYCTITNIQDNTTTGNGGGAFECSYSVFLGTWHGNSATGSNNFIHNSLSSLSFAIQGTGAAQSVVTTRATINWN